MPVPSQGRVRLERALINVHRAGRARGAEGRRHAVPDSQEPGAERSAPAAGAPPAPPPAPAASAPEAPVQPPAPETNGLAEVVERLRKIEERLASLQGVSPAAQQPATPGLFAEWVRLRQWQEIPFAEFLKLRRAGRI